MAGILTVQDNISLDDLRAYWRFTHARLTHEPLAAALLGPFAAFGAAWDTAAQTERQLQDDVVTAEAGAVAWDVKCNVFAAKVHTAVHGARKVDTSNPNHVLLFGNQTLTEHNRPILGAQLLTQSDWPVKLSKSTVPALSALAADATALVAGAKTAESTLSAATAAVSAFRNGGARSQVFATFNALCAKTFGELKAIALNDGTLGGDWAESFFRRGQSSVMSAGQADQKATKAQEKADRAKKKADELAAEKAAKEAAAAEKKKQEEEVKALEAAAKVAAKAASDAKKKLKK